MHVITVSWRLIWWSPNSLVYIKQFSIFFHLLLWAQRYTLQLIKVGLLSSLFSLQRMLMLAKRFKFQWFCQLNIPLVFSFAVDEDLHITLAHQLYKSGNYKKALEHSNAVYERNSLRTDNLLLLGAICYQVSIVSAILLFICWLFNHQHLLLFIHVAFDDATLFICSCMIMTCVLPKMKKHFVWSLILQSVMGIWQMHGR